ncbi:hypothetical protein, partial [[Eubacterium] cellulosolvens]
MVGVYYISPGPVVWVAPLTAFASPIPVTPSYYAAPAHFVPAAPVAYSVPPGYLGPVVYEPLYYSLPAVSPPRG